MQKNEKEKLLKFTSKNYTFFYCKTYFLIVNIIYIIHILPEAKEEDEKSVPTIYIYTLYIVYLSWEHIDSKFTCCKKFNKIKTNLHAYMTCYICKLYTVTNGNKIRMRWENKEIKTTNISTWIL